MKNPGHVLLLLLSTLLGCGQQLVEYPLDAPTVSVTDPTDAATGVAIGTRVSAAFSEAMDPTTLTASTFTLTRAGKPVPAAVRYAGTTAILTPQVALAMGTLFTATLTTGATDVAGDALAAPYVWHFTTLDAPDATPPTVSVTDPANGAVGVSAGTTVEVAFDQTMDCATLDAATFTLTGTAATVPGVVTCKGPTATFTPASPLAAGVAFTATITTGARDPAGNALAKSYVWGFTTGSAAPTITSTTPANGAMNVSASALITATFDEAMNAATITGTTFLVKQEGMPIAGAVSYAGTTATFTPTVDLGGAGPLTATVTTGVTDLGGKAMAADFVWTFDTGTAPTVISTNPTNAAHGVAIDRAVDATFSVPMNPLTIDGTTFTVMQGANLVAGAVTYAGTTATFTPVASYPLNAVLTATITTGAEDTNGDGLLADYVWSFETGGQVGQAAVPLGAASAFAILAFNTVTNVNNPGTVVTGDLGISPGAALVGFPPGQVIGTIDAGDAAAAAAKASLLAAYNNAVGRLGAAALPGDVSGLTFTPGLYSNSTSLMLSSGNFTLDAQGDGEAVFIFQMGSTLTTLPGTQVILSGGAQATNIFWAVGTSATLGTGSKFKGTILAASAITMETGASIEGRLLAQGAAVALDTNAITVPP